MPYRRSRTRGRGRVSFCDPWGRVHEHWADSDRLNIQNGSNILPAEEALVSQWGDPPPQRFIEHISA